MYKIHSNILLFYFLNLFSTNLSIQDHFTMQTSKLHITAHQTNMRAYSIQVCGTMY